MREGIRAGLGYRPKIRFAQNKSQYTCTNKKPFLNYIIFSGKYTVYFGSLCLPNLKEIVN